MFLVGGPAFSGTTLLALMLNQGDLVCLDEPDFHKLKECHRSIPILRAMFSDCHFPDHPLRDLGYAEAVELIKEREDAITPRELGIKTCDEVFLAYAELYRQRGWPIIGIFRDIRDSLVRPAEEWITEQRLNYAYRMVWERRNEMDVWIRYENLIEDPAREISRVGSVLGRQLEVKRNWAASEVHPCMLKTERHQLLKVQRLSSARVGIWKMAGKRYSRDTRRTARMMGY